MNRLQRISSHLSAHESPSGGTLSIPTSARTSDTIPRQPTDVVIVSVARTPVGSLNGALSSMTAPQLGSAAIKAALKRANIAPSVVQEVFMGNVLSAGQGQAPARQAALGAGLPNSVPCTTVNKVCASGTKAVMFGAQAIMTGTADCVVVGGMESMSNVPYYLPKSRQGYRLGHQQVVDGIIADGLWDAYGNVHMGQGGELCSRDYKISRQQQDDYAIASYQRAVDAAKKGLNKELVPVELKVKDKNGKPVVVSVDEEPSKVDFAKLPKLNPAFVKEGTVTAANASKISDGAAALVLMSRSRADALGVKPLARIRGFGDAATEPLKFTVAPALAIPIALKRAQVDAAHVDYYEINEAFSVVALANMQLMNIPHDRINIYGGGVSVGHPIGCSGARIVATLLSVLQNTDARYGVASVCNGGGGASAIVIERE